MTLADLLAAAAIRAANDKKLTWEQMKAVLTFLKFYAFSRKQFLHVTSRHVRAMMN